MKSSTSPSIHPVYRLVSIERFIPLILLLHSSFDSTPKPSFTPPYTIIFPQYFTEPVTSLATQNYEAYATVFGLGAVCSLWRCWLMGLPIITHRLSQVVYQNTTRRACASDRQNVLRAPSIAPPASYCGIWSSRGLPVETDTQFTSSKTVLACSRS